MALTQIKSSNITDGTIVNADVNASAAIDSTKLSGVESGLTSVQVFTSSGTFKTKTYLKCDILIVGGGGGAGYAYGSWWGGGAGGAGELIFSTVIIPPGDHAIVIGAGGAGATDTSESTNHGTNGVNTTFLGDAAGGANTTGGENVFIGANDSDFDYYRYAKQSGALSEEEILFIRRIIEIYDRENNERSSN